MLLLIVTAIPLAALALTKLPACVSSTLALSAAITPTRDPPLIVAEVVPLYTLSATTVPLTVNARGVMLARIPVGWVMM